MSQPPPAPLPLAPEGITFPLTPRPAASPAHAPAAYFVAGADPAMWLRELAEWGVPLPPLRLYVVPASARDRSPIGVLVTGVEGKPKLSPRARPYGCLAGRLFLPVDAVLDPPVSDEELRALLRWKVNVLHPSAGLSGFAEPEALRASDLLAPPPRRTGEWDRAVAGPAPPPRLTEVEPDLPPPSMGSFLDGGRDDIGSEAPKQLPPLPEESRRAAKDVLKKTARPGLKAISWLTSQAPAGAAGPTWVNGLQNWANRQLQGINSALEAARHRELQRLREMLKKDPDLGLKYAIPLSGAGGRRGASPPGATLSPHDVNFDYARLGGGSPGDVWDVPWEIRQELLAQYRAAASRELALGRHRRAAYIFAELLGDYASAANALEQGRHYREAALVYRERLFNHTAAAQCLEQGGLLTEAAALYEELHLYEKAAALHLRLDRPEEATRCYRAAVDALRSRGQTIAAARMLETKLAAPDEALALLDPPPPGSDSAAECLREWFDLLGRLGRHEQAARRVARLRSDPPEASVAGPFVAALGSVAARYPDGSTRTVAADAARVIVGRCLPAATTSQAEALLDVVRGLAPHDRLLSRDVTRYVSKRRARPATPPALPASSKGVVTVHQFRLPDHVAWRQITSTGEYFYALGEADPNLFLVRGRWDGVVQGLYRRREPGAEYYVLEGPRRDGMPLTLFPLMARPEPQAVQFPRSDAFRRPQDVLTPAWLPEGPLLGACLDEAGVAWVAKFPGAFTLNAYRPDGALAASRQVEWDEGIAVPTHIAARNGHVFVASLSTLARVAPTGQVSVDSLPGDVRALAASPPFTRVRIAASLAEGAVMVWDDGEQRRFAEGMANPSIGFTRGGSPVALAKGLGRAYRTDDRSIKLHATFTGPDAEPLGVVATDKMDQFASLGPDGVVRVYQITG